MSSSLFYPLKAPVRRKRSVQAAGPAALTLVAATYDPAAEIVLTFDRPIDISAIVGSQIIVDDMPFEDARWFGGIATLVNPTTVSLTVVYDGGSQGQSVTLTASASTGIVAVDDGGTWAGVTGLELPFGT